MALVAKMSEIKRGYLEHLPSDYNQTNKKYPCIFFLHGSGEKGYGTPAEMEKIKNLGLPKFIKNGHDMTFTYNGKEEKFIVLCPQQIPTRGGWTGDVIPFIKWALQYYRIDPNRVYVTGLSMGGEGSWSCTYDANNNPNLITAIAPVAAKGDYNGAKVTASHKIPVWAFHGENDTTIPVSDGRRPINGMNSVGADPAPIFELIKGGAHNNITYDNVYSPTHQYRNPNIYEWFLSKSLGVVEEPTTPEQPEEPTTPEQPEEPSDEKIIEVKVPADASSINLKIVFVKE